MCILTTQSKDDTRWCLMILIKIDQFVGIDGSIQEL